MADVADKCNAALHKIDHSHIPPLRIAARYAAGRPRATRRIRLDALLAYQFAESKVSAVQLADILRQSRPDAGIAVGRADVGLACFPVLGTQTARSSGRWCSQSPSAKGVFDSQSALCSPNSTTNGSKARAYLGFDTLNRSRAALTPPADEKPVTTSPLTA